jgi:exosortase/archaeosortase family protein
MVCYCAFSNTVLMSEKKQKQPLKKQDTPKSSSWSISQTIQSALKDKHPVLKFLLGFVGCMAIFYLMYFSSFYQNQLEQPITQVQASLGSGLLQLMGYDTKTVGAAIGSNDFSIDIKNGCDGLEAIAILVSGILIFPATKRQKAKGLLWGIGTLLLLNIIRIAGLFIVGLNFSKQIFDIMHVQGGFIVFTIISVLILFTWMNWVIQTPKPQV